MNETALLLGCADSPGVLFLHETQGKNHLQA
jgi:hypothetical protein